MCNSLCVPALICHWLYSGVFISRQACPANHFGSQFSPSSFPALPFSFLPLSPSLSSPISLRSFPSLSPALPQNLANKKFPVMSRVESLQIRTR